MPLDDPPHLPVRRATPPIAQPPAPAAASEGQPASRSPAPASASAGQLDLVARMESLRRDLLALQVQQTQLAQRSLSTPPVTAGGDAARTAGAGTTALHQGRLSVESDPAQGLTATPSLGVRTHAAPPPPDTHAPESTGGHHPQTASALPQRAGSGAGPRVAQHCRLKDELPFEGLVPRELRDSGTPLDILQHLSLALGFTPEGLAEALRGAVERTRPSTQLLLAPDGPAKMAEQAAFDYAKLRSICGRDMPASHDEEPANFTQAAARLREAFTIVADRASDAPSTNSNPDDEKSRTAKLRRMPHVSATDEQRAKGAVPARHLDYLASADCRNIEDRAAESRHERDVWQECARIVREHGGAGWAILFSNGMSLERSADDGRVSGSLLAAREALIEAIKDLIVKVCLGPSERLRESLDKQILKVVHGVLYGDFDLESIVAVLGASPSQPSCAEAGVVAGDPSMGRPGSLKETLQIDMPKALSRLSDLLLTVHQRAGDGSNPPGGEGLRLNELWHGASGLPLLTSKLPDGITEVVGSQRLIEVALRRMGRVMRERRRQGSNTPIDFPAEVKLVFDHELRRALDRQGQYQFALAVSGKPTPKPSEHAQSDRNQKRDQNQQQTDKQKQNQPKDNSRPPKRPRGPGQAPDNRGGSGAQAPAGAPANSGANGPPRREEWMTFAANSITHTVAKRTGPPNLVCAGEQIVAEALPNVPPSERPCIWNAIFKGGCKKGESCQRCRNRAAQLAAGKPTNPIPAGLVAKLRAACTPALAELLK